MNAPQQPLEISRPMGTVFAIVMGIALIGELEQIGNLEQRDDLATPNDTRAWREEYFQSALTVTRHTNAVVEFPRLGVVFTPADGWSCLTTVEPHLETRPTWVNEKAGLIARLSHFPFADWPPETAVSIPAPSSRAPSIRVSPATDSSRFALDIQQLVRDALEPNLSDHQRLGSHLVRYQHLEIDWIRFFKYPALDSQLHLGRIESDAGETLLMVIHQSQRASQRTGQIDAVTLFCDQFAWLSTDW